MCGTKYRARAEKDWEPDSEGIVTHDPRQLDSAHERYQWDRGSLRHETLFVYCVAREVNKFEDVREAGATPLNAAALRDQEAQPAAALPACA